MIAHGDHVFLARQSSEVPVQHEHERAVEQLVRSPRLARVVDELERWQRFTEVQRDA